MKQWYFKVYFHMQQYNIHAFIADIFCVEINRNLHHDFPSLTRGKERAVLPTLSNELIITSFI